MRLAAITSAFVVLASAALLYQTNVRSERPPKFGRGGAFAGSLTKPGAISEDYSIPTAVPRTNGRARSEAVLRAPETPGYGAGTQPGVAPRFPAFARYVYSVDGYEETTGFGRREYPPEETTTVHRTQPTDPTVPRLKDDEVIFDLYFSDNHEEREIVAYRPEGIVFTYEAGSVTFGPATRTSEATYEPPMMQIPVPLRVGAQVKGTTEAKDSSGTTTRVEDWTVKVLRTEYLEVLGQRVGTWVVKIDRQSRPGSSESVTRSRTYWFDPNRSLWVKWHETLSGAQNFGPGRFTYRTEFTATLSRIERS
jgi:hypothetical protein